VILLALESATSACSAAVADSAGRILGHRRGAAAPDQADRLIELIDAMLREAGLDYGAIDVIAVNRGPGSFTGVRAGVAAARGLALATGRPVIAVNTLEVLAAALGAQSAGTVIAALDARRGQIYVQVFGQDLVALSKPRALAPAEVVLAGLAPPIRLAGNGADLLRAALPDDLPVLQESAEPDALGVARRAIARIAAGERPVPGHAVRPLYLREPDARLPEPARVRATAGA
jgi:tRNA threonylcarbamoyladenosine biosynthesis protein TsaB